MVDAHPGSDDDYQIMGDLASGKYYGVFIDDSGSPGLRDAPSMLSKDGKTWVAVIVPPDHMKELMDRYLEMLTLVHLMHGANELHFKDIHAATGAFVGVAPEVRLELFLVLAKIFEKYRLQVLAVNFDPDKVARLRKRMPSIPQRLGPFDLTSPDAFGLFYLFMKVSKYLKKEVKAEERQTYVVVDSGLQKHGKAIVATWELHFARQRIFFATSDSVYLLQLADFAAFSVNRTQLVAGRKRLKPFDLALLRILSPIASHFRDMYKVDIQVEPMKDGRYEISDFKDREGPDS